MNDVAIFVIGSVVFATYIFFLSRMIYKQHKIQSKQTRKESLKSHEEEIVRLRKVS